MPIAVYISGGLIFLFLFAGLLRGVYYAGWRDGWDSAKLIQRERELLRRDE